MAPILSLSNQQLIKKISLNNAQDYSQIASEVEEKDLKKLIGTALLQDIQTNPTSTKNVNLLTGDTFTNLYGFEVSHKGLNYVIAYMNYARYIGGSFVKDTFTGLVQKTREDSQAISEGQLKRLMNDAYEIALLEWDNIKMYLDENASTYDKWNYFNSSNPYPPKLKSFRKTGKSISAIDYKLELIRRQYKP